MNPFGRYVQYLRDNPERYWFKRKWFGWGWTPATWEGWLITLAYIALLLAFSFTIDKNSPPKEVAFTFFLPLILLTVTLIRIAYKKGEKPRWQWGLPKEEDEER
jgi:Na+-transporting NADH:ubiquinone oxidoreductase subunit NqrB